ncbi:metal ABC transporter ATP-binding protein [Limnoglobus roseus]|uniref:Metal ABC transporter ATP-binding protein n=1 Tax=Limnoglobus roseus TaxID=2598579 RepID=A0A5C1AME8_9BACT|nr:metal ABC transporter ATP-binding protein [Limnoglobus roseus]QEL18078.1 metal ABC transporter ATP-binding protein [Limnoglobus roseus]
MPIHLPVEDTGPPTVAIRKLCVNRGGRPILSDLSCDIPRGKITAIVGLNGCGKSTLLRTLVGEFRYTGTIQFACGEDHSKPRPDHVGYVPQRLSIEASLPITVRDLLGLTLQRWPIFFGVSSRVIRKMTPMLDRVGVPPRLLDVPIDGLSGGQLQRVMLALALEPKPELLLLDEPSAGIDFKDQESFNSLLAEINDQSGTTIILVSHDLNTLSRFADRVLCLRNGRIISEGKPAEVLTPESIAKTFGPVLAAV